jgi:predicted DNA-binding transcriptional regulator AlpA
MLANTRLLRFGDLEERNIVPNRTTLKLWVEKEGFPPGRLLGPATRVWTEEEIHDWFLSRPQKNEATLAKCHAARAAHARAAKGCR